MKIKEIILNNIFSYYNENIVKFDLSDSSKNIHVLYGRNGNGKTSFINAIKLLFLGTDNDLYTEQLRKSVSEGKIISVNNYVLGNKDWFGIVNSKSKKEGNNACSVSITFIENNKEYFVNRSWILNKNISFDETLTILERNSSFEISGKEAEKFLHKRIPPDFVDFFFFDGEQIQQIAEANRSDRKEKIVKLLNITGIDFLTKIVRIYRDELKNQSYENRAQQTEITTKQKDLEEYQRKISLIQNKIEEIKVEIDEFEEDKTKYENRKKDIYINGNQNRANELNIKKEEYENELAELKNNLINILSTSFLSFNQLLINQITTVLNDEIKKSKDHDNVEFVNILIENLPNQLFNSPPKIILEESTKNELKSKLEKILNVYKVNDDNNKKLTFIENLSHNQLIQLQSQLQIFSSNRENLHQIVEINDLSKKINDINFELKTINDDPEEQKELIKLERLIDDCNEEIEKRIKRIYDDENSLIDYKGKVRTLEHQIELLDRKAMKKIHLEPQINLSGEIVSTLREYRDILEKTVKNEVERYLNEHYQKLIDSNTLIQSIKIEDDFNIVYLDENNDRIGMSSISAGMKQIVALSLLWSLKESTNRVIPVIIDTPLGRIDYQNQLNILSNYYPNASNQVIILPTDSEINKEKFETIKDYVASIHTLNNKSGVETKINIVNNYGEILNG